jgi:rhodanese-related sulfurtransferase
MLKFISTSIVPLALIGMVACSSTEEPAVSEGNSTGTEQIQIAPIKQTTAAELETVRKEQNAIILDVRTPAEVAEGYIDGTSKFIDVNGNDFSAELAKLDKSATYIVYCRSGGRSMRAAETMVNQGFQHVYNLQGGITGWTGKIVRQ